MVTYNVLKKIKVGDKYFLPGSSVEETKYHDWKKLVKLELVSISDTLTQPTPKEEKPEPVNKPLTETENDDTVIPVIKAKGPAWLGVYFKGEQIGKSVRTEDEAEEIIEEWLKEQK